MTRTRTVLVVEDNSIEREGMAAVLRQEGFDAVLAANGKEALERLQGKPTPDVMLLDMMMSEMDGWQLLKMLRQYPDLVQVPVIIVTGLGIANIEWARSLGAAGLVRKPMDVEHLKDALAHVFGTGTKLVRFTVPQPNEKPVF
jgi:two-component system sensor histidine kinase/response regulator FitF